MFPGISVPGTAVPMGVLPTLYRESTASLFSSIFDNPDAEVIFLVEAHPYAPVANRTLLGLPRPMGIKPHATGYTFTAIDGEADIYLSAREAGSYKTGPRDATLPSTPFLPRLSSTFRVSAQLFSGLNIASGANSRGSEIQVINEAGEFNTWADYGWDGRTVYIKAGLSTFDYADFGTVAKFTAQGVDFSEDQVTIILRDKATDINQTIQQNLYAGTGGKEGGSDIAGSPKPLGFGMVRNAPAKAVDTSNLIYQLHDGQIEAVVDVRDQGVSLTAGSDYATYALLAAASPAGGSYDTCLAEGFIKLGSIPSGNGRITVDFKGDKWGGTYVSSASTIARRIVTTRLGVANLQDPDDLDAVSFADVETENSAVIGLYIDNQKTVPQALTEIMSSIYGFWYFDRTGLLSIGIMRRATEPVYTLTETLIDTSGVERLYLAPPPWRVRVGYKRMWETQTGNDLAGSVSAADKALYENQYRFAVSGDTGVRSKHRLADTLEWPTLLDEQADAESLASKIMGLSSPDLRRYRVPVHRSQLRYWLNDEIKIDIDQIDLTSGVSGIVTAIEEDYDNGTVNLEVVG